MNRASRWVSSVATAATWIWLPTPLPAQLGPSPDDAVRKILVEVSEEMREIDRMLLESSRKDAAQRIDENVQRIQRLMEQTQDSQGKVVRGIERLMEEIAKMAQQQSGSPSEPQDQDPSQDGQQQQQDRQSEPRDGSQQDRSRPRSENRTPDVADQPREPGQEQPQRQPDGTPRGDQDAADPGRNVRDGTAREDGVERVDRPSDDGSWGNLPPYLRFLHNRGGEPDLPPKYRRLIEAYLKRSHDDAGKGR